jgi:hypothetical protein
MAECCLAEILTAQTHVISPAKMMLLLDVQKGKRAHMHCLCPRFVVVFAL